MALYSEAGCILRVDMRCEQCKYKILEVLSSIIGVFNVDVDGVRGLVMVAGQVDPNVLLRAVASTGRHAEVVRINFRHPNWMSNAGYHAGPIGYSQLPMDYGHYYPYMGGAALGGAAGDFPFRRSSGHGYGLLGRHHAHYGSFGHRRWGFGGGGFYKYAGGYNYGGANCCGHF